MKPAPFDYFRPETLAEAIGLLRELGPDAKVLAGGQSLVPMMNLRLAKPSALIDIGALRGHSGQAVDADHVRVGALSRHLDLERSQLPGPVGSLVRRTAQHIGHLPIRTRGTIGGSVAHADPAAEWCLFVCTLDADLHVAGVEGTRIARGQDFFTGFFQTTLAPEEILIEIAFPRLASGTQTGIVEFARRAGDFAIVSAMTVLTTQGGRITGARIGVGGVSDTPVRAREAEALLVGEEAGDAVFHAAAVRAAHEIDPPSDLQASAEDRRDLTRALVARALAAGRADASHEGEASR